jgi:uncharacterized protein (TIGR02466 family)
MFNINSIFPTSIVMGNLDRKLNKEELEVVDYHKTRTYNNSGNTTSLDRYILKTQLPEIKQFIDLGIKSYVDSILIPKNPINFYITQSWLNYTEIGQYHHKHAHPNSIISGVFYFSADPEKDKIYFYKDKYRQIVIPPKEFNIHNSDSWWFSVKTGGLVIFPSHLTHMVEQTVSNETRVSLAFNVFAKGYIGEENTLTALHL